MEALLLCGALCCGAFLIAFIIGRIGEASIRDRPEVRTAEDNMPKRAQMENRFELRLADLQVEISRATMKLTELRRRRFQLERELMDAKREADAPIRVIGREGQADFRFRAWMVNRQVQQALSEDKEHGTLDADWASPQVVEVWADNVADARKELQRIFPMPLGFAILNVRLETPDGRTEMQPQPDSAHAAETA